MIIYIINGPNFNYLGKREVNIYGNLSFKQILLKIKKKFKNIKIKYFQTNSESKIIDILYFLNKKKNIKGILLNAAAYSHTSLAISDCIKSIKIPIIEIHMSNIFKRSIIRNKSLISKNCKGIIIGLGINSYILGIYNFLI
ncbi:MAG: type II 3-dehydroquinate dehydratase [Candidatus Shikimatogenerans sp. Tser]|uniref:3-dehydroquinate dehydratase n=1 Tax=Candidatus Shikimatogenerans sp. Tser TaxID=3158568 RepID=A0AAU7QQE3_9FLAO